jgi:hypothetical protein
VYWPGGHRELPRAPKCRLAGDFIALVAGRFALTHAADEPR